MSMEIIERRAQPAVTEEQRLRYAGIWLLKQMDLDPKEGGMVIPIHLPPELTPLDEVLHELQVHGHVEIHRRKDRWEITKSGLEYLRRLYDEAEALIDEFEDAEVGDVVAALRARQLDVFRALFLWEWYTGELDDLVLLQQRRGAAEVETLWAYYLVSDEFYELLAQAIRDADRSQAS